MWVHAHTHTGRKIVFQQFDVLFFVVVTACFDKLFKEFCKKFRFDKVKQLLRSKTTVFDNKLIFESIL